MSASFELTSRPIRRAGVAWRVVDGEAVMVLPATGKVHTLNQVGTRFWQLADGQRTFGEVIDLLAEEFDAPRERIEQDCREFARELASRELISVTAA